jgi:hypothetical protein
MRESDLSFALDKMDENHILRSIVLMLRQHPGEWFTFRRASSLIPVAGVDDDVLAAFVEYRPDLFSLSDDRRFKLRTSISEDIAHKGVANWEVPSTPERARPEIFREGVHPEMPSGSCYCDVAEYSVLKDLVVGSVPDAALVYSCCWRHICRVRGLHFGLVADDTWREICQRRGYLRERENPRGF